MGNMIVSPSAVKNIDSKVGDPSSASSVSGNDAFSKINALNGNITTQFATLRDRFGAIQHIGQYTGNNFSFNLGGTQKCLIVSIVGGNANNTSGVITFVGRYFANIFAKTIISHNATHTTTQNGDTISVALAGQDGDYARVSDVYLI